MAEVDGLYVVEVQVAQGVQGEFEGVGDGVPLLRHQPLVGAPYEFANQAAQFFGGERALLPLEAHQRGQPYPLW